jgi:hypothetical protein
MCTCALLKVPQAALVAAVSTVAAVACAHGEGAIDGTRESGRAPFEMAERQCVSAPIRTSTPTSSRRHLRSDRRAFGVDSRTFGPLRSQIVRLTMVCRS